MNDFEGIFGTSQVVYRIVQVENSIYLERIFEIVQSLNGHFVVRLPGFASITRSIGHYGRCYA